MAHEFPSVHVLGMKLAIAQARSNKVAISIGIQDLSQLRQDYGRDAADALFNLPGNIISGQVSGDSARLLSERFGRILQEKTTVSTNSRDNTSRESRHIDPAVPAIKIANLSSGGWRRVDVKLEDATKLAYGALHYSYSNLLKVRVRGAGKIADIIVR